MGESAAVPDTPTYHQDLGRGQLFASPSTRQFRGYRSRRVPCADPLSLLGPRVLFLVTWISTSRVGGRVSRGGLPLLGLLFFPWTALLYTLAYARSAA